MRKIPNRLICASWMRKAATFAACLALLPLSAHGTTPATGTSSGRMLLDCQMTKQPPFWSIAQGAGKTTEFIGAAFESGYMGLIYPPDKTWSIDFGKHEIMAGDGSGIPYKIATLTETNIRAFNKYQGEFTLNRLSGELQIYRQAGSNITIMGLTIPSSFSWTFRCSRSTSPLI